MTFLVTSAQLHIELTANSSRAVLLVTRTATVHSFRLAICSDNVL